ncbi:MAG TPA: ATP-dependent DNA helicase RecG [Mycobacteriales bacterium]|nr:ATP-dependent DNA helicase RecG [Mycobacteriales bacterium]
MVDVRSPLRDLVGDKTAKVLEKGLGLRTCGDLLRHYPRRYVERGVLTPLTDLREDEYVTVQAEIVSVARVPFRKAGQQGRTKERVEVVVTDGRGKLKLTFFNQGWRSRQLTAGMQGLFAGKVGSFRGQAQLVNPQTQLLDEDGAADERMLTGLIAVYPATTVMPSWNIAKAVRMAIDVVDPGPDPLPEEVRARHGLLDLQQAIRWVHVADTMEQARQARQRLKWDEAFVLQTVLAQRRAAALAQPAMPRLSKTGGLLDAFDERLPFALTAGQREVGETLLSEIAQPHPMHRLLQGEVGSGKTIVALRAMLAVVDAGGQAALLAPTEVLAQQHHRTIRDLLGPLAQAGELGGAEEATRVALLTGSQSAAARRSNLLDAASGAAGIVVGTHALLEQHVQFADLGLVVVDEQHRFGVEQRDALRSKGDMPPHVLVMTATPIPRTVAMTVFGDLETSTLSELPAGRSPIQTTVVPVGEQPAWLDRAWTRIREEVAAGRQAYVVCARIGGDVGLEEIADLDFEVDDGDARRPAAAVVDVAPMLADGPLHGLRVGVLHGRLAPDAKDDVMRSFARGEIDVLVATTVIEVGVDVPNATVMVVLDADRFGVSQLHQLRGRVGRGAHPGLCLLVTDARVETPARERVDGVASTLDGFQIARLDLEQRREGDVLGAAQSGRRSSLRLLRLLRDEDVIEAARQEATALVDADPTLSRYDALVDAVRELLDTERADYLEKA